MTPRNSIALLYILYGSKQLTNRNRVTFCGGLKMPELWSRGCLHDKKGIGMSHFKFDLPTSIDIHTISSLEATILEFIGMYI